MHFASCNNKHNAILSKIIRLFWVQASSTCTQRNLFGTKLNLDCNYPFPIDLAPIGIPIGVKYIGAG